MALNAVVLPAPFGPMRLVIVPGCTRTEIPASATTPPHSTRRSSTISTLWACGATRLLERATLGPNRSRGPRYNRRHDSARQEEDADDQDHAVGEHLPLPRHRLAQRLRQRGEQQRADHGTGQRALPSGDD